jgi:hypothetical protein
LSFKAFNLSFTLATGPSSQVLSWSSPPSHMTPCHVSYAISSFITSVSIATYPNHFHLHGIGCSHLVYLWTNHLCISHKHILVHWGCHSIAKIKQGSFTQSCQPNYLKHLSIIFT